MSNFFFKKYILFVYLAGPGLSYSMWDLVPSPGIKLGPLHWEHGVLAPAPPGMSLSDFFLSLHSVPGIMVSTSHKLVHFILPTAHDVGIIIAPILQMRKLRPSGLHNLPIVMKTRNNGTRSNNTNHPLCLGPNSARR